MAKRKFSPRGPWQTKVAQPPEIPKDDPKKLRMRAEKLKLHAARLENEDDELFALAERLEAVSEKKPRQN